VKGLGLRRAITIIGRFAFGGWAIVSSTLIVFSCIAGLPYGFFRPSDNPFYSAFILVVYGLFGLFGGAVVGLIAAVLDRLIKRPAGKVLNQSAPNDPGVWPPAPKPPL
jgi:hypothetical protein